MRISALFCMLYKRGSDLTVAVPAVFIIGITLKRSQMGLIYRERLIFAVAAALHPFVITKAVLLKVHYL